MSQNYKKTIVDNTSNTIHSLQEALPEIYDFNINSYQICQNWLQSHQSDFLSNKDIHHYQRIVMLLKEMVKLVEEIKAVFHFNQLKKLEKLK